MQVATEKSHNIITKQYLIIMCWFDDSLSLLICGNNLCKNFMRRNLPQNSQSTRKDWQSRGETTNLWMWAVVNDSPANRRMCHFISLLRILLRWKNKRLGSCLDNEEVNVVVIHINFYSISIGLGAQPLGKLVQLISKERRREDWVMNKRHKCYLGNNFNE